MKEETYCNVREGGAGEDLPTKPWAFSFPAGWAGAGGGDWPPSFSARLTVRLVLFEQGLAKRGAGVEVQGLLVITEEDLEAIMVKCCFSSIYFVVRCREFCL